jgi:hypothetical protein
MEVEIQEAVIMSVGAIITTFIGVRTKGTNDRLEKLEKFVKEGFVRLEKYHSKDSLLTQLRVLKNFWVETAPSEASARLAIYMKLNVWQMFNEIAVANYTREDFERTKVLFEAVINQNSIRGRQEFDFSDEIYSQFDDIVERHAETALIELEKLANDNIFNDTFSRLEEIFFTSAKNYMKDALPIIIKNDL